MSHKTIKKLKFFHRILCALAFQEGEQDKKGTYLKFQWILLQFFLVINNMLTWMQNDKTKKLIQGHCKISKIEMAFRRICHSNEAWNMGLKRHFKDKTTKKKTKNTKAEARSKSRWSNKKCAKCITCITVNYWEDLHHI